MNDPARLSGLVRGEWSARIARQAYSTAWLFMLPLMVGYLLYRAARQPAYLRHWGERFGFYRTARSQRPLVWIHAVSVGETRAAQPLVVQLQRRYPNYDFLLTNGTPTGRATNVALYGSTGVTRCYLPYDFPWCVNRFLKYFRPQAGILLESELWPNLIAGASKRSIPMMLVNARLSEKSLRRGLRWPNLIKPALARLDLIVAQTERDKSRLIQLDCEQVQVSGNLKFDVTVAEDLNQLGCSWRQRFGSRSAVLLASSRDGEEEAVLRAWPGSASAAPMLMVVPRHPERFDRVYALIADGGWNAVRRTHLNQTGPVSAECLLGDSMGEMFAYYGAADIVIMGGSLLPFGGQNLIEACASGVPVIVGPHTFNFEEIAEQAILAGAARRVESAQAAVDTALALVADHETMSTMSQAALDFAARHRGATELTIQAIAPILSRSD